MEFVNEISFPGVERWWLGSGWVGGPTGVELWRFFRVSDAESAAEEAQWLDETERHRAGRLVFAADRMRWIWWRSRLRLVLGQSTGRHPASLRFETGPHGKPFLRDNRELPFNLSHSGEVAVLGVSRSGEIGVDVEVPDPKFPALDVAREYFRPAEVAALDAAHDEAERQARFFRLWTAKEAIMKATGLGMALEPGQIEVRLTADGWPVVYAAVDGFRATDWRLWCAEADGCVVSVAQHFPAAAG